MYGLSGAPLVDVNVWAYPTMGGTANSDMTDITGAFSVTGLSPGTYNVKAWPNDYNASHDPDYIEKQLVGTVTVGDGDTPGIDFYLQAAGSMSGYVYGPDGLPVEGVCVSIWGQSTMTSAYDYTDSVGYYEITGLAPDGYSVGFITDDYNVVNDPDLASRSLGIPGALVSVSAGVNTSINDVTLQLAGKILGRAFAADGVTGLEGIQVSASSTMGYGSYDTTTTVAGGWYELDGLAPGKYSVGFSAFTYNMSHEVDLVSASYPQVLELTAGGTISGIDLALQPAGTITGHVYGPDGLPLANVDVAARLSGEYSSTYGESDANGLYTITGLAAGAYTVSGSPDFWHNPAGVVTTARPGSVGVTAGNTTSDIDLHMQRGGGVEGTVSADGVGTLEGIDVSLSGPGGTSGTTGVDGTFAVRGLTAGVYSAFFDTRDYNLEHGTNFISEYYSDALNYRGATGISVSLETTSYGINATLEVGGSISGTVYGPDGVTGVGDIRVYANSLDGTGFYASTETGSDGAYVLRGIPAGSYEVEFITWMHNMYQDDGLVPEFYQNARTSADATPVSVKAGVDTPSINATMEQGGVISGTVFAPDGTTPAENVWVDAISLDGMSGYSTNTTSSGGFEIKALPAGDYVVSFKPYQYNNTNDTDYLNEFYPNKRLEADAVPVSVVLGGVASNTNATLDEGSRFSGTVTGDGGALLGDVFVQAIDTVTGDEYGGWTDLELGTWKLPAIPPGTYSLQFNPHYFNDSNDTSYVREFYNNKNSETAADVITVVGIEKPPALDAQLAQVGGLALTFTINVPDGMAETEQIGELWEVRADGSKHWYADTYADGVVGDSGTAVFRGLTPGTYLFRMQVTDYEGYYQAWAYNGKAAPTIDYGGEAPAEVYDAPMELADPIVMSTTSRTFAMNAPVTGTVTGRMVGPDGGSIGDARLDFLVDGGAAGWLAYDWTYVGEGGILEVDLAPGTYKVRCVNPWEDLALEQAVWYPNKTSIADAQTITVGAGGTVNLGTQYFPLPAGSLVQETNGLFQYSGSWSSFASPALSGGAYKYSNASGATSTLTFHGTGLTLLARCGPNFGKMSVKIDGGTPTIVDLWRLSEINAQPVFSVHNLTDGPHTVVIAYTGEKNAASSGTYVNVDAAFVEITPDTTPPAAPTGFSATGGPAMADLKWDAVSDAAKYTVYKNGSYFAETSSTSYRVTGLPADTTYNFKVTATDAADNQGAYAGPLDATTWKATTLIEETNSRFAYAGTWSPHAFASYSGGTYKYTGTSGAKSTFNFNGTAFALVARTGPEFGKVSIAIDGGTAQNVDLYSASTVYNTIVYLSPVLTDTSHSVEIAYTGLKNAAASGTYVNVDAMIASLTPDTTPPAAPTGLAATATASDAIDVTWNAVSDAVKYEVYKNDVFLAETTALKYSVSGLTANTTYSFKVKAFDEAGNPSEFAGPLDSTTWPNLTTIEETDAKFAYTGTWSKFLSTALSGGSYKYVNAGGAKTVLSFNGTAFTLIARKGPEFGKMDVSIDGGTAVRVDLYDPSPLYKQTVFTSPTLTDGNHKVTISWTGARNAAATNTYINIDAAKAALTPDVIPPATPTGLTATAVSSTEVLLSWDAVSDAVKYRIYLNDGATPIKEKDATSYTVGGLTPATLQNFKVTAVDPSGNESVVPAGPVGATTFECLQQDHGSITRTGAWSSFATGDYSGGSYMYSNAAGTGAVVEFYGTQLNLMVRKGPEFGLMAVSLDGGAPTDIDLYHSSTIYKYPRYKTGVLAEGWHTVKFLWTGRKNASAVGTYINIDAVEIAGEPLPAKRFEQGSAGFTSAGSWSTYPNAALSGGSYAYANSAETSTTLSFEGRGFSIVARKGPEFGKASLVIDGVAQPMVDFYNATPLFQATAYRSAALEPGPHTVTLSWTGQKNASATNTYINIDAIDAVLIPDTTPPAAPTGLTATAAGPTAIDVSWNAVADAVKYRLYKGDGTTLIIEKTATAYQVSGLTPETLYDFKVRAVDEAGNESDLAGPASATTTKEPVLLEQDDAKITRTGAWSSFATGDYSGGSYMYSNAAGTGAVVEFWGTQLDLLVRKGPEFGMMAVSVDGGAPTDIDLYHSSTIYKYRRYTTTPLAEGWHTVKFSWTGRKNASAVGTYINIDAIEILDTSLQATRHEQGSAGFTSAGTWSTYPNAALSGGSYAYANSAETSTTLSFFGSGFSLVARKGPEFGKMNVSIDGQAAVPVDLYSASPLYQYTVYRSILLVPGNHTVTISWTGQKNASATNTYINIDAIDTVGPLP